VKNPEKKILDSFQICTQRLFTAKFLEKLHTQFTVNSENKLEFTDLSIKEFLRIFSASLIQ